MSIFGQNSFIHFYVKIGVFTKSMVRLPSTSRSHGPTVTRGCCKGDYTVNGEGEIWPLATQKPLNQWSTKFCEGNCVWGDYNHAKFYPNRFRGFGSAHAWFRDPWHKVTRLHFWVFLRKATAETRAPILTQNTSYDAVPRKQCLLGVAKPKFKVSTSIFPQNWHFWDHFDGTIFFARKRL